MCGECGWGDECVGSVDGVMSVWGVCSVKKANYVFSLLAKIFEYS